MTHREHVHGIRRGWLGLAFACAASLRPGSSTAQVVEVARGRHQWPVEIQSDIETSGNQPVRLTIRGSDYACTPPCRGELPPGFVKIVLQSNGNSYEGEANVPFGGAIISLSSGAGVRALGILMIAAGASGVVASVGLGIAVPQPAPLMVVTPLFDFRELGTALVVFLGGLSAITILGGAFVIPSARDSIATTRMVVPPFHFNPETLTDTPPITVVTPLVVKF